MPSALTTVLNGFLEAGITKVEELLQIGNLYESANTPLIKSDFLFVPQGTPLPLKNEMIYSQIPKDSMFVFAKNRASPACKSTYSTSTGQVCTTAQQQAYIGGMRGNNKNFPDDSF